MKPVFRLACGLNLVGESRAVFPLLKQLDGGLPCFFKPGGLLRYIFNPNRAGTDVGLEAELKSPVWCQEVYGVPLWLVWPCGLDEEERTVLYVFPFGSFPTDEFVRTSRLLLCRISLGSWSTCTWKERLLSLEHLCSARRNLLRTTHVLYASVPDESFYPILPFAAVLTAQCSTQEV